ncbi:U-box domain-containing protein 34 isoform X3 [Asparagus officinalis]|uniref:U-box domain-containing protein 34 isoform X3 n=1 Tax=Asparagus officinalis TaxID=4686 RepID=UPI00098E8019|nr:U-box domain-containing protein 34 isoform X3 [Asparagus officinalis]
MPHAHRALLVHVIPSVTSVPNPTGKRIPTGELEREVVDLYVQDLRLKAQKVMYPFKRLCPSKNVDTLVLNGQSPAAALLRFLLESGMKNLVLGSSSLGWFRRILKGPDVPTTILKSAPDSCNIFIVSRNRLTMKVATESMIGSSINMQIQKVSLKAFTQKEWNCIFNKSISSHSAVDPEILHLSVPSDLDSDSQVFQDGSASITSGGNSETALIIPQGCQKNGDNLGKKILDFQTLRKYDNLSPYKEVPYVIMNSEDQAEAPQEVVRLRKELQNTLAMYKRACEGLVHAKKKVALLSTEYSEDAKKVKDALEREEMLKRIAEEEKAKHLEAIKEVEEAKQLLSKEALDRHKAQMVACDMSSEKFKIFDSLLSNGKNCRRYSKNEIEVATDNFSESKMIGEGSYGKVYKCNLDHTPVAIKVLRQETHDKKEEFIREVEVLSQLHHPHMVLLLGGCPENGCLVYEYMENGSLEDKLFCKDGSNPLPWFVRFRIIFEVACGLAFLHGTKPEPIVHRDLKPGNILLDRNYVSKIGDVGLAKLISDVVPDGFTEYRETVLAGTLFYMDPEYQRTDWPLLEAEKLAKLAVKCCRLRCRDRPDLDSEVLPELEELCKVANVCFKLRQCNVYAPSHYLCPILQEIMENPHIAADGYTYEYRAIKAWLGKHKISPVTKLRLSHTCIIPNYSLLSAIQEWKSSSGLQHPEK